MTLTFLLASIHGSLFKHHADIESSVMAIFMPKYCEFFNF